MGCDSHPCIEVKGRNGRWGLFDEKYHYYKELEKEGLDYSQLFERRPSFINALGNRNYTLFSVLAGVRNSDPYITPLFDGRGVPDDVSKATMKQIPFDSDYHSHTYFTVAELLETDWDETAGNGEVCLYAADYLSWKETGKVPPTAVPDHPENSDRTTREVSEEEMVMMLLAHSPKELTRLKLNPYQAQHRRKEKRAGKVFDKPLTKLRSGPYVKVQTPLSYRQIVPGFIECIPDLQKLGEPDKVRVVIAFDN